MRPLGSLLLLAALFATPAKADCVILLHGLARTGDSMIPLGLALDMAGQEVVLVNYPSTEAPVATLAAAAIPPAIHACDDATVHVVTHSMGAILLRSWLADHQIPKLGRVVMLAPPNRGSEIVDAMADLALFELINGPAGAQLGTGAGDLPAQLPSAGYELGVIAGDHSVIAPRTEVRGFGWLTPPCFLLQ